MNNSFKSPLPLNNMYFAFNQASEPSTAYSNLLTDMQSQQFPISDDDLHYYVHQSPDVNRPPPLTTSTTARFPPEQQQQGGAVARVNSMYATSPQPSSASPQFAPSSSGSVPFTTSLSMSPPSTGLTEPSLPLTPYSFPSLFPATANNGTSNQHPSQEDPGFSPSVSSFTALHQPSSSHHDNVYTNNAYLQDSSQQHAYSSYNFSTLASPLAGFNPMSAPADYAAGNGAYHNDNSFLGAFGLGLKIEDEDERQSLSMSPNAYGISAPLRNASGVLMTGEEEAQFSMEIDEDGSGRHHQLHRHNHNGDNHPTLFPSTSSSTLRASNRVSHIDTRSYDMTSGGQIGVYNHQGQLVPFPQSAPAAGGFDDSLFHRDAYALDSPASVGDTPTLRIRPRRSITSAQGALSAQSDEYVDPTSTPARRPRLRTVASSPLNAAASAPNRSIRSGLGGSGNNIPVGPGEMVITATLPIRPGGRGRAATFGGRAPRSVVPTPVPNLTKKSRGRRVPVARPLDLDSDVSTSVSSSFASRRSSRASANAASAALVRVGGDDLSVDEEALDDEDDDAEFAAVGSRSKSKSKMSPRMQALVDEAIARGCSTTASGKARIFTCPVGSCLKCFARGEHLKRHVRSIHTEEKPFECSHPGCGKKFSRHDNLKQHKRVHKDKPLGKPVDMERGLLQFDLEPMDPLDD